jgi:phenylpyruvate tautomerase PptA (4-oxalocrotonate tautomerase family)
MTIFLVAIISCSQVEEITSRVLNNNNITVQQKLEIIKELTEINPKCLNALLDYD